MCRRWRPKDLYSPRRWRRNSRRARTVERDLPTVWRALTDPDLLEQWLLRPTGFTASVGTRFRFTTPASSIDEISCEVLAARRCVQLTYSWMYSRAPARWIVDWTIRPQGSGTNSRAMVGYVGDPERRS
ncbi:hypothetical protein F3087_34640 [Nocardia colli]|uniref:Activator of Hsp90 ATPase homologue 1/2-like C-terminal domain-containing protein n=1 Tax=Nocardia colli TaxID=2545717 RepID=A0A5N0E9Z8_9NOCA|nr:SRPBCC domain-containing protein [Nocardia colli]KAA8884351.1 hypothetical protein F3087_34640 [Nocardia colli]